VKKFKIIFMGTPNFAVPALKTLHKSNYNVALVVTQPDRPKGRGRKLIQSPVKESALKLGYNVIQPFSCKTDEFVKSISKLKPDLFIVVAFGQILPESILAVPRIGAINIHASLLPKYRGAAPIQWAVINGEKETGVTTMFMDKGMDTGDILLSAKEKISSDDTSVTLHDRLSVLGSELLTKTLKAIETNDITPTPQDHGKATYAPLLKKKDGRIDWKLPAENLDAFIRGMSPWPGAFTFHDNKRLKIFKAATLSIDHDEAPGTVVKRFPDELLVATGKGALSIMEIQGASGKRLLIKEFLRGTDVPPGTVFI